MKRSIKHTHIFILFLIIGMTSFSQDNNENWVKTTVYKKAFTNEANLPTAPSPEEATVQVSYFDGLGRPVQVINHAQSNTGLDIIQHIDYDVLGRQTTEYLPFTDGTTSLDIRLNNNNQYFTEGEFVTQYNAMPNYETAPNPFSKKELENSPLNRVLKQAAPGSDWELGSGHEIKFDYKANAVNEVRLFTFTTNYTPTTNKTYEIPTSLSGGNYYQENQLYKTITRDENATATETSYTIEYKNKLGQVVLKRVRASIIARTSGTDNSQNFDTYYIYDDFGNLTFVLPPLVDTSQATISSTVLDGLCYQYKYDYRNRLVEKKIPGKRWEYIVYDKLDRVRATGPTKSPFNDLIDEGWLIIKYDAFDRPVLTGWMIADVDAIGRANLEDTINTTVLSEFKYNSGQSIVNNVSFSYQNNSYPSTDYHILTVNYYDNYDYYQHPTGIPTTVLGQNVRNGTTVTYNGLKSLPTGSWIRTLEHSSLNITANLSYTLYQANRLASPLKTVINYPNGGYTKTEILYDDFEGKVVQTVTEHRKNTTISAVTTIENFTYTAQGRLISNTHKIDTDPVENIVTNEYKELGELKTKNVGQTAISPLQKVDYTYNIRGWLTGINNIDNLNVDAIEDLFAFKISYNAPEDANTTDLFNGNISETYWRTNADNMVRKYKYEYDGLNRLLEANYRNNDLNIDNTYNEHLTYDKNGNILSLQRNGGYEDNTPFMIDNLSYLYQGNSNQLKKVIDDTLSTQGFKDGGDSTPDPNVNPDYNFDEDGNMTKDENKNITLIKYNHLNLPTEIQFINNRKINYVYDANGIKLKKEVNDGTYTTITDYLNGYQYEQKDVHLGGRGYSHLLFFPHAEGYVKPVFSQDKDNVLPKYGYVYNHTDHLGNIRVSYAKVDGEIKVLEESNYYSFGLKHSNYNANKNKLTLKVSNNEKQLIPTNVNGFKYKYNNKELQDEFDLNTYDLGARHMDPALGRFMVIDPLTELINYQSPYVVADNNPVFYIDVYGLASKPPKWWNWIKKLFKGGRKRPKWDKKRKPPKTSKKSYSFHRRNKRKTNSKKPSTTDPNLLESREKPKGLDIDWSGSVLPLSKIEFSDIDYISPNNPPKPPKPKWYTGYGIYKKDEEILFDFSFFGVDMSDETFAPVTVYTKLNLSKSGSTLGKILNTLKSDPRLDLYFQLGSSFSKSGTAPVGHGRYVLNKQNQKVAQYLINSGINPNRIHMIKAMKVSRIFIK